MKRPCPDCQGKGRIEDLIEYTKTCWQCGGRGWFRRLYYENEKQFCKRCGGKGSILFQITETKVCSQCNGQGRIITDKGRPFTPGTI